MAPSARFYSETRCARDAAVRSRVGARDDDSPKGGIARDVRVVNYEL